MLLATCLAALQPAGAASSDLLEVENRVQYLLGRADAMYWFALEDGGNRELLERGLQALEEAALLVAGTNEADIRADYERRISALRVDLLEQVEMAHDTVNGILPLFRFMAGRDPLSEWFDDPWVVSAVRSGSRMIDVVSRNWPDYPQFDVVYGSRSPALENEIAYVFNQNNRFFNHHRGELAAVLDNSELDRFEQDGLSASAARKLSEAWGLQRLLEVRLNELFVDDPICFNLLTATLHGKGGQPEGTVFAFGMVKDQRAKTPWIPFLVALPILLVAVATAGRNFRQAASWLRPVVAGTVALLTTVLLLWVVRGWLPPGESLLVTAWWAPAGMGAGLLVLMPAVLYSVAQRFGPIATWFFASPDRAQATAAGLGAGVCSVYSFSVLAADSLVSAVGLTLLATPFMAYVPLRVVAFIRGRSLPRSVDFSWALLIVGIAVMGMAVIPVADRTQPVVVLLLGSVGVVAAGALLSLFSVWWFFPVLVFAAVGGFGAALMGNWLVMLPFAACGIFSLAAPVVGIHLEREPRRTGGGFPRGKEGKEHWEQVFREPSSHWELAPVTPMLEIRQRLSNGIGAVMNSKPFVLAVYGASGTGKTRMISEILKGIDLRVYAGRCRTGSPFAFLQDALRNASSEHASAATDRMAAQLGTKLLSALPVLGALFDFLVPEEESTSLTPELVATNFLKFIQEEASLKGTSKQSLLWVDDTEHLEPDGARLLEAIIANAATLQVRIALVVSGRNPPELAAPGVELLHLEWDLEDLHQLLAKVLDREAAHTLLRADSRMVAGCYVDWIRYLWNSHKLKLIGDRLCIDGAGDEWRVPDSVTESAGKAMEGLPAETVDVLRAAALDGMRFHISALAKALAVTPTDMLRHMELAEEWGIVEDLPEDEIFGFRYNHYREFLLQSFDNKRGSGHRQRYFTWNRGLAEAYKELPGDHFLLEAAGHAQGAGLYYREEAVRLSLQAAQIAFNHGQWSAAKQFAEFVLDTQLDKQECPGSQLWQAGTWYLRALWCLRPKDPWADEHLRRLHIVCSETPSSQSVGDEFALLACEVARALWSRHTAPNANGKSARELLDSIDENSLHSVATRIRLLHFRAATLHKTLDKADCTGRRQAIMLLEQASKAPVEQMTEIRERAEALNTLAEILIALNPGKVDENRIRELILDSIRLKEVVGDRLGMAISYGSLGRFYFFRSNRTPEDLAQALQAFQQDLVLSEEVGDTEGQIKMRSFIGSCFLAGSEPGKALDSFTTSLEQAEALGRTLDGIYARIGVCRCLMVVDPARIPGAIHELRERFNQLDAAQQASCRWAFQPLLDDFARHPNIMTDPQVLGFVAGLR